MSSHTRAAWASQEASARSIVVAINFAPGAQTGENWILENTSKDPTEYQYLHARRLSDGLALAFDWPEAWRKADKRQPARLTIALVWPTDAKGDRRILRTAYGQPEPITSISVDASKPADVIARDVRRRLLPDATRLHLEALRLITQADQAASAQRATVAAILAVEPGSRLSANSGDGLIYLGASSHGYTLRVDTDRSIRFEPFSVDLPAALRILEALRRTVCHTCSAPISATQAAISTLRAEGAPARCADCISAELAHERHTAEDPHCTCNDCIADLEAAQS